MLAAIDALSLVLGATIATLAARFPARTELLETCAGVLLIGGLLVAGSALPV
jgi:hypothetical protein